MKSLHAEVESLGGVGRSIAALACIDSTSGLVLDAYRAAGAPAAPLIHAAVEVPGHPGLVVVAAADEGMEASLEKILVAIAIRLRVATAG